MVITKNKSFGMAAPGMLLLFLFGKSGVGMLKTVPSDA
jgi:hypothetical protein